MCEKPAAADQSTRLCFMLLIKFMKRFNPPPTAWNDFKDGQAKNTIPAHLLNKSLIFQIKSHLARVEFKSNVLLFSD